MILGTESAHAREFELTRTFDAPRDLVFKVWTDPRYVVLWWGLEGTSVPRCQMNVRPGGAWRIDMQTASGTIYPNSGVFLEVIENERLVYNDVPHAGSPAWGGSPPGTYVHTVSFEEHAGGGTKVSVTVRADSEADCERLLVQGMRDGMAQSLDRLARLLREIQVGATA